MVLLMINVTVFTSYHFLLRTSNEFDMVLEIGLSKLPVHIDWQYRGVAELDRAGTIETGAPDSAPELGVLSAPLSHC